jgi:hypothetical protein
MHPEQSFRLCLGILKLAEKYSPERLEAACAKALTVGITSYKRIREMLANGKEKPDPQQQTLNLSPTATHINVRGTTYYQ